MRLTILVFVGSCMLLGCSVDKIQAFYLSKSRVSGVNHLGTSHCTAVLLKQNNEFTICRFIYGEAEGYLSNTEPIANGIYAIKNDTLKLHVLKGKIDKDAYLINYENNEVSFLTIIPGKVYNENGQFTGIEIRGTETKMNSLERKLIRNISSQLNQY